MALELTNVGDLFKKAVTNDMKRLAQKVKASETKPAAPQRPTTPHVVQGPPPMGVTMPQVKSPSTATPSSHSTPEPKPTAQTEVVAQADTPLTETPQAEAPSEPMDQIDRPKSPETKPSEKKGKKHRKAQHKKHRKDRSAQPIEIHIHLHLP